MNLTGQKISAGTAPSEILPLLGDQLVNCVLWEPSVLGMIKAQGTHGLDSQIPAVCVRCCRVAGWHYGVL